VLAGAPRTGNAEDSMESIDAPYLEYCIMTGMGALKIMEQFRGYERDER